MSKQIQDFFPLIWDSTMLMEFDSCPMAFFRKYIQHLNSGNESTDLIAGGAFAKGLEIARKGFYVELLHSNQAVELGAEALYEAYGDHIPFEGNIKTCDAMQSALEQYFWEYPMELDELQPLELEDGTYAIEYRMHRELPLLHPTLGLPLQLVGRADMLAYYADKLVVSDEKTTKVFTKDWAAQWDMRGQFTTYCHLLQKVGLKPAGAFIRGVAIQKTSIKFQEYFSTRSQFQIDTWEVQMLKKIQYIIDCYTAYKASGDHPAFHFNGAFNEACNKYFRICQFTDLCRTQSAEKFIESQYSQYIWLPHLHKRIELSEYLETLGEQ